MSFCLLKVVGDGKWLSSSEKRKMIFFPFAVLILINDSPPQHYKIQDWLISLSIESTERLGRELYEILSLPNYAEKTLESPLDCKEIQLVQPKGNQSWIFIGKTDAEAETPILWPPDVKNWLIGKDPVSGKDWRQEEKGTTEDEMVGWHHWLNGHKFE